MDKRLLTCAALCVGKRIADIGTDHGYLPCYMVKNGLCESALACDVAPKPLESAKAHIHDSGLEERVTALLSDGLKNVPLEGVSDIVIAGMGGELIVSILEDCQAVASSESPINLVLQPMTKWDVLRKWLYDHGFEVIKELACTEGRFVYSVMQVQFTGKKPTYECDLRYLYCGLVTADEPDGREYLKRQAYRLKTAGEGRLNSAEKAAALEMIDLSRQLVGEMQGSGD